MNNHCFQGCDQVLLVMALDVRGLRTDQRIFEKNQIFSQNQPETNHHSTRLLYHTQEILFLMNTWKLSPCLIYHNFSYKVFAHFSILISFSVSAPDTMSE